VRLHLIEGPASGYAIAELALQDLAFCASPEAFFQTIARAGAAWRLSARMSGEQSFWTVVGVDGGAGQGVAF